MSIYSCKLRSISLISQSNKTTVKWLRRGPLGFHSLLGLKLTVHHKSVESFCYLSRIKEIKLLQHLWYLEPDLGLIKSSFTLENMTKTNLLELTISVFFWGKHILSKIAQPRFLRRHFWKFVFMLSHFRHVQLLVVLWTIAHKLLCPSDSPGKNTEWVAISFSTGSFWLRDWTRVSYISCTGRWVLYHSATWEALWKG